MKCPHCGAGGISPWSKAWSDKARPARCALCGGLSHAPRRLLATWEVAHGGWLMLVPLLYVAWPAAAWACLACIACLAAWRIVGIARAPMTPTDDASARIALEEQRVGLRVMLAVVAVIGFALLLHRTL